LPSVIATSKVMLESSAVHITSCGSSISSVQETYLLRGLSPQANYTDRETTACRRS
jgi:hypothetical protein